MSEAEQPIPQPETPFVDPAELQGISSEQSELQAGLANLYRGVGTRTPGETLAAATQWLQAERARLAPADPPQAATDLLQGIFADIATRHASWKETGRDVMGHSTGFPQIDRLMGGLEPGRISILLAAPGAGKTTLSNQMAYTLAASGVPVVYLSYENDPADLILKQVARLAGKNIALIRRGHVSPYDLEGAYATLQNTAGPRLFYMAGTAATTPDALTMALQQVKAMHPGVAPVVIIDYLQQMARAADRYLGEDMRTRVGGVSRSLTDMAKSEGAHVWAISSVGRGNGKERYGDISMGSGKESGDIEFDADAVLTLKPNTDSEPSMVTDALTMSLVKNRHGEQGAVTITRHRTTLAMEERDTTGYSPASPNGSYAGAIKAGWKDS